VVSDDELHIVGEPITGDDVKDGEEMEVLFVDDFIGRGKSGIAFMTMLAHIAAGRAVVIKSLEAGAHPIIRPTADVIARAQEMLAVLPREETFIVGSGLADLNVSSLLSDLNGRSFKRADRENKEPWYRRHAKRGRR
jgi:hypothetical protein